MTVTHRLWISYASEIDHLPDSGWRWNPTKTIFPFSSQPCSNPRSFLLYVKSYFNVTYRVFCLTSYDLIGIIGGIWLSVSVLLIVLLRVHAPDSNSLPKGLRLLVGLSDPLSGLFLRDALDAIRDEANSTLLYIWRTVDTDEGGAESSSGFTNSSPFELSSCEYPSVAPSVSCSSYSSSTGWYNDFKHSFFTCSQHPSGRIFWSSNSRNVASPPFCCSYRTNNKVKTIILRLHNSL